MILRQSEQAVEHAVRIISNGGVIAFRTDTFYGLGADPQNPEAISRIRSLKNREEAKPILLLISHYDEVARFLSETSEPFAAVAKRYWPGPITIVGMARPELPQELTAGSGTIGVRLPDDETVRALVHACGGALTATSANQSGSLPARTAKAAEVYFAEGIDLIIDGGEVTVMEPSTVLDLSGPEPRLIREGAISRQGLAETLKERGMVLA
jgi:L-threonylcarbamoyladenylate synthase